MENLKVKEGSAFLHINPELYPIEAIYSAAYVFLDDAFISLDGDRKKEIIVQIQPKKDIDPNALGCNFFNELINYSDYQKRAESTKKIREMILQRAIISNDPSFIEDKDDKEFDELLEDIEEDDFLEDPDGIAIPWEEKYGKSSSSEKKED